MRIPITSGLEQNLFPFSFLVFNERLHLQLLSEVMKKKHRFRASKTINFYEPAVLYVRLIHSKRVKILVGIPQALISKPLNLERLAGWPAVRPAGAASRQTGQQIGQSVS